MADHQDGVSEEHVSYRADGAEIPGIVYRRGDPDGSAPGVLVLHGGPAPGHMQSEAHVARALARRGFVVLSGTYRQGAPSPYDNEDAAAALTYLSSLPRVDADRLGMTGHSRGGFASVRAAGSDPRVRSVVAYAAGTGLEDVDQRMSGYCFSRYVELFRYGGGTPESHRRRRVGLTPGREELERIKIPILWIQGTRDFSSPPDAAMRAYEIVSAAGNQQARIELIRGADHFWGHPLGPVHERVAEMGADWFQSTIGARVLA